MTTFDYITIAALVISLLSLVLVLNRYRIGRRKSKATDSLTIDPNIFRPTVMTQEIRNEIIRVVKENMQVNIAPAPITAPEPPITHEWPEIDNRIPVASIPLPTPPPTPVAAKFYAKFPADEQSFSSDMLVQSQDGEQVYELEITGDSGTYKISESEAVQRYALSEDKYLLACAYDELPLNRNVRIINQQTGTLSRRGRDWHIDQKVYIKFA